MQKLKSTLPNMVIVLGLIAAITSSLLALVYIVTKEPLAKVQETKLNKAISDVVPGLDRFEEYKVKSAIGEDSLTFYKAFNKDGEYIGTAVKSYDNNGFNGYIEIIVGFDENGNVIKDVPLKQGETPGLGAKMADTESHFITQWFGKNLSSFTPKVKKDGGDVDAITAATISSRAYCRAMDLAYQTYLSQKGGNQ